MGDVVRLLALIAVAVAAYIGWCRYRYPGGWACAFGHEYAAERNDLDGARGRARALALEFKKELDDAQSRIDREERRHREHIRGIERRIDELREPGRGRQVARFGGLTLHEHAVLKGEHEISLAGLRVWLESAQHQHFVYLAEQDGDVCYEPYSCTDYAGDDVRHFAMQLEKAVAEENAFRSRAVVLGTRAEDELARAKSETHAVEEVRRRRAEVIERQRQDPRKQIAHSDLEAARDRWQKVTGRRPH